MRLSFGTISLPLLAMSKRAISPRRRSGTSSNCTVFLPRWKVSKTKKCWRICSGVQADRLQQDRHRHLAAAVDAEIQVVLGVELEVEPRAAVGNDARREQQLARGVGLAAVVLEEHARRAVQLRHDDALGAVDDERAGVGHERNLAHVDLLLLHFLDGRLGRFLVHDRQAHLGAQRRGEGQPALLALLDVERRRAQRVAHELEARIARMALDREDRGERRLQTLVLAALGSDLGLQEGRVRFDLRRQQKRHRQHVARLAKLLRMRFFSVNE